MAQGELILFIIHQMVVQSSNTWTMEKHVLDISAGKQLS
jgi:hypothetical protein